MTNYICKAETSEITQWDVQRRFLDCIGCLGSVL